MCTVVFRYEAGRLLLAMNRDERRGRAPEVPPDVQGDGPLLLAPRDGEKGGTWIGVNDRGVAACILNGYGHGDLDMLTRPGVPSRGRIIPTLLRSDCSDLAAWVQCDLQAELYPSFTLLVWTPGGGMHVRWRLDEGLGWGSLAEATWGMESSSAWRTKQVLAWRRGLFDQWIDDGAPFEGRLPSFNLKEVAGRAEWSPFMSRPFSATRSITVVDVDRERGRAQLLWWPRPGDGRISPTEPRASLSLDIAAGEAM